MHSSDIEAILTSLRSKRELLTDFENDLKYCDDKTQDILHKLELDSLTYHETAKTAKELEAIRKRRRKAKDEIELLLPITGFLESNKRFIDVLTQVLGEVRKIEKRHGTRRYTPRITESEE